MGLNVACAALELGADVICIDRMEKPLSDLWSSSWCLMYIDEHEHTNGRRQG